MPKPKKNKADMPDDEKKKKHDDEDMPMDPENMPDDEEDDEEEEEEETEGKKKPAKAAFHVVGRPLIASVYDRLWSIMPEKLFELAHWPEKISAGFLDDFDEQDDPMKPKPAIVNGIAIVNVFGVLDQRPSFLMWLFGGCSTEALYKQIEALGLRQEVKEIALNFACYGGAVDGIEPLSDLIYKMRDKKSITAFVNNFCYSGGVWLATACSKVYVASRLSAYGQVGVVTAHRDVSKAEEMFGIKTTEITAGKYKRIDSQYKPLSEEGKAYLQERVDYAYTLFVDAVARNRGVSSQDVLEKMADGRIFIGAQAVDAGLADGILSLEDFLKGETMGQSVSVPANQAPAAQVATQNTEIHVSEEYLASHAPDLLAGIQKKAREEGFAAGAKAERERIQVIEENTLPGYEAMAAEVKFDGKTTGDQLILKIFRKQKEDGVTLSALRAENKPATPAPTATGASATDDPKAAQAAAMMSGMEMAKNKRGGK